MASTIAIVILGAALLVAKSGAILPRKCSFVEYLAVSSECLREFSGLSGDMFTANRGTQHPWATFMNLTAVSCQSGLFDRLRACKSQGDKMCEYSIITDKSLENIFKLLCSNTDGLSKLGRCMNSVSNSKIELTMCISSISYDGSKDDPICALTKSYRRCLDLILTVCDPPEVRVVNAIIDEIVGRCEDSRAKSGDECSRLEYVAGVSMCWTTYALSMMPKFQAIESRPQNVSQIFCADKWKRTLSCQAKMDAECERYMVNVNEVRIASEKVCSSGERLMELTNCFHIPAALRCLTNVMNTQSVCEMMNAVRKCYNHLFKNCHPDVYRSMTSLYDIIAPRACSTKKDGRVCSAVEHVAGSVLCWKGLIVAASTSMAEGRGHRTPPNVASTIEMLGNECQSDNLDRATSCHTNVDRMCGMSLVKAKKVKTAIKTACSNLRDAQLLGPCFNEASQVFKQQCPLDTDVLLNTQDKLCRRITYAHDCFLKKGFSGNFCTPGTKNITDGLLNAVIPTPCATSSHFALSRLLAGTTFIFVYISNFVL